MQAIVREGGGSERAALLQLIIALQDFERALDTRLIEGRSMAVQYLNALETRCRDQKGAIFVAQHGEEVIGFVAVQSEVPSTDLDEPPRNYALISDLVVAEQHRGRGVGRKLLATAESFARQQGATDVRIGALCGNQSAERLYHALGFRPYLQIFSKRGAHET